MIDKEDIEKLAKSFKSARNIDELKPVCPMCKSLESCISYAFDEDMQIKCIFYGWLKNHVKDYANKVNAVGVPNLLASEELKALICFKTEVWI